MVHTHMSHPSTRKMSREGGRGGGNSWGGREKLTRRRTKTSLHLLPFSFSLSLSLSLSLSTQKPSTQRWGVSEHTRRREHHRKIHKNLSAVDQKSKSLFSICHCRRRRRRRCCCWRWTQFATSTVKSRYRYVHCSKARLSWRQLTHFDAVFFRINNVVRTYIEISLYCSVVPRTHARVSLRKKKEIVFFFSCSEWASIDRTPIITLHYSPARRRRHHLSQKKKLTSVCTSSTLRSDP